MAGASAPSAASSASSRGRPGVQNVDQDRIEKAPVRRMVGARPLAVAREQHVHGADAEIGRPRAARRLAGERQRRKVADALIASAPQRVELRGDSEPFAFGGRGAVAFRRRDRELARDAVDSQPMAADRQVRQRDRPLLDRAAVGKGDPGALAGADPPFEDLSVLALDPGLRACRRVAQRDGERRVGAQRQRIGDAAAARLVDQAAQAVARLRFAARLEPERRQERDLGLRRDDGALAADVPPFAGDSGGARERVDGFGGWRTAAKSSAWRRAFGEDET